MTGHSTWEIAIIKKQIHAIVDTLIYLLIIAIKQQTGMTLWYAVPR